MGYLIYRGKVENGDTSSYDTEEEWTAAENAGVVCLPAAGLRDDDEEIRHYGGNINYWSSTLYENGCACGVISFDTDFYPDYDDIYCGLGCSVRLVADAPKLPEVPVESISLSETELELIEGLSESLTVTFTPAEATKKAVFWSSDNTSVATVDQTGKVSAVSVGTATITAVADGLAKASCAVTVKPLPLTGTANAIIGGDDVTVNWVQLWAGGPRFADRNVGASSATGTGIMMTFTDATQKGSDYVWGDNWCTPSKEQMNELLLAAQRDPNSKVECECIKVDDNWGFKFTGKGAYAGNSVFFPASYYNEDACQVNANYWSSSVDNDSQPVGMSLIDVYDSRSCDWCYDDNCLVRPVLNN